MVANSLGLNFDYPDAAAVLAEINSLVPTYKGITRERLGIGGLIWPCPSTDHPGTPILHSAGFKLQDGRALIAPVQYKPAAEETGTEYPLILTTGRIAVHFNAGSMTRRSPSLMERAPNLFVEINPVDAAPLGIKDGIAMRWQQNVGDECVGQGDGQRKARRGFHALPLPRNKPPHYRSQGCGGQDP